MSQLQRIAIAPAQIQGQQILLTAEQQHYLMRVLRLKIGDRFIVIDPQGGWWLSVLQENNGQILEPIAIATELPATVSLIVAMPKGNGLEEIVRQTTELGVSAIYPVMSDRSLLKPSPQKIQRWRRIAQEAAEQSERAKVPTIFEPIAFSECLGQISQASCRGEQPFAPTLTQENSGGSDTPLIKGGGGGSDSKKYKYICVARGDRPHLLKTLQGSDLKSEANPQIAIATGPEGGWTATEVEQAIAAGFQPISLGDRILKAVTAPIVALSLVAAYLES
ncbi:16S rRNA (uracil(1498)-N(3))-methyltransferase [Planktothricoides raciborskii]|uniref:Ribosomal RNA small subunit methyltransferase E n=1 Tax=Planktothricoides raciborskii GIHE-MW2 TaxID=2792601 RepID=A0AAU8JH23_9CYAN